MNIKLPAQAAPEVPAGDLLLLLAAREARLMAMAEGIITQGALEDWGGRLPEAERWALDSFDKLILQYLSYLRAAHRAVGV